MDKSKQIEIDQNYEAFEELLPELVKNHRGQYVVMRKEKPIEFFDTLRDAMIFADKSFDDNLFSIQEVSQTPIDLGWFSDAPIQSSI